MKIGITYDLRSEYLAMGYTDEETAEFDREDTIESIENTLQELGHETARIGNVKELVQRIAEHEHWDLVFNIAEGVYGYGREAQVPAILEAYTIPYTFSDPLTLAMTLHKETAKRVVQSFGIPTPRFRVVHTESDIRNVALKGTLFAKPMAEGTSKGITSASKIETPSELRAVCQSLLRQYEQPVLVEEYLPGREFTVGILGTGKHAKAIGTLEVVPRKGAEHFAYTYNNKEFCEELIAYNRATDRQAEKAEETALAVWDALGCRDAGRVDLREDVWGEIQFIEVNPLSGLHPTHSDLPILCSLVGITYTELIASILESTIQRYRMNGYALHEYAVLSEPHFKR